MPNATSWENPRHVDVENLPAESYTSEMLSFEYLDRRLKQLEENASFSTEDLLAFVEQAGPEADLFSKVVYGRVTMMKMWPESCESAYEHIQKARENQEPWANDLNNPFVRRFNEFEG